MNKLLRARLCANHPEQYAIKAALEGPQGHLVEVKRKLRSRRDLTMKWCAETSRVSCVAPRGAFYAYPRIDIPEGDDVFVKELIRQKYVTVVHGSGFGQRPGTKHFRIVFLPDEKTRPPRTRQSAISYASATRRKNAEEQCPCAAKTDEWIRVKVQ